MTYRSKLEGLLWKHTSPDFKSKLSGVKCVLVHKDGVGTTFATLGSFTVEELYAKLPRRIQDAIVDSEK